MYNNLFIIRGKILIFTFLMTLFLCYNSFSQFKVARSDISSLFVFEDRPLQPFPFLHFNRVEGFFLGAGVKYKMEFKPGVTFSVQGGYGFSSKEWKYKAGLQQDFFKMNKFTIGTQLYQLTCSLDDWYIGWIENSLAALFFNEDFMDYFDKKGYSAFINQVLFDNRITLRLEASDYDYGIMERTTEWSLLRKKRKFRENPIVTEGHETSLKYIISFDGRDNPLFPIRGWLIDGIYEHTYGDFNTDGLFFIIKRFQPTFGSQQFRTKAMLGTRKGSLANQHLMDLGGLGTLPGFKDKEFKNGNRFMLFSLNYHFHGDILRRLPLHFIPVYDAMTLSLLFDAGWLHLEDKDAALFKGFKNVQTSHLKTDAGFALAISEEMLLLKFAKRLDRSKDAWRILLRLTHKF